MIRSRVLVAPALAAGLAALSLPLMGQPAHAAEVDFGYSSKLVATPFQLEIFEPTIPLPARPQAELDLGYSRVVADSSSARSRSSYLWPGAAVGEGAKTIEEGVLEPFPLPDEIKQGIYEQGYPFQVNATYPGGPNFESDEQFPGMVQRAGASEEKTYAQNGYSTTCDTSGTDNAGGGSGGGNGGGGEGLPALPPLPFLSGGTGAAVAAEEEPECPIPADLKQLVSFGGYASATRNEITDKGEVKVTARTAMTDINIAAVVQLSGVKSRLVATSDGGAPKASGKANYGTVTIAGQEFGIGPEGVEGGDQKQPIPGLPDEPNAALKELGITITVPKPDLTVEGKSFEGAIEGLVVEIDSDRLSKELRQLPLADIVGQLPSGEGIGEIKKALQAALFLSPRFVFHFGSTQAELKIADPIEIPTIDIPTTETPTEDGGTDSGATGGSAGGSASTGGSSGVGSTDVPVDSSGGGDVSAAPSSDISPVSSPGLPPLASIPGMLMVGALAGAALAGSYVRKLGAAALGLGGACSDGLESGLPDLRKA